MAATERAAREPARLMVTPDDLVRSRLVIPCAGNEPEDFSAIDVTGPAAPHPASEIDTTNECSHRM